MLSARFLFFGAGSPWVYALAAALAECGADTAAVAPIDRGSFRRQRPRWPTGDPSPRLQREWWVLPRGYAGALAPLFAPLLQAKLGRSLARLRAENDEHPWVIVPYPWFETAVRRVPWERLVYYNYDDYPLFRPERAAKIVQQERRLLTRAALTLCASQRQTETLRAKCPERADAIRHFPHGVVDRFLNPRPERPPAARTVGYVGNLTDRVDWRLVTETARALWGETFLFVGGLEGSAGGGTRPDWEQERAAALALPNVRQVGPVAQDAVAGHYWNFAVNWIPYVTDHAFNLACCPTKIMDGLAAGRPVVSTDVPECRLYPAWITIVHSAVDAAAEITRLLTPCRNFAEEQERSRCQVSFARERIWSKRAGQLLEWL